jgi:hypothetical protein
VAADGHAWAEIAQAVNNYVKYIFIMFSSSYMVKSMNSMKPRFTKHVAVMVKVRNV